MPKTALLLIDLQKEVLHPDGKLAEDLPAVAESLLEATRQVVSWARERQYPVIWVRAAYRPGYIDAARTVREAMARTPDLPGMLEGSWGVELVDGVGRRDDDVVITKRRMSAFFQTDLDFVLRGLGVEQLIVGGTSTNWAVESTVRDGHSLDYQIVVVREATGARIAELHEPSLRGIATRFAQVKTLAEVLESY